MTSFWRSCRRPPVRDDDAGGVLVAMLRVARHLADWLAGAAPLASQRLHLLDVFVLDFCERVNGLLRGGAIRKPLV